MGGQPGMGMQQPGMGMQQPGMGMQPYQPPGAIAGSGTLQSAGNTLLGPTRRNALMTLLIPMGIIVGGSIVGNILTRILMEVSPALAMVGSLLTLLLTLGGCVLLLLSVIKMVGELKSVTRNDSFAWWPMIVPIYSIYWACMLVPPEVTKAKQALGVQQPTRGLVLYLFLLPYALAADINDMVR
jgi:hypothetical protein